MTQWFKTKIKYLKQNPEDGSISNKTEEHLISAVSFTEAESRLQKIMEEYVSEYNLLDCSKMNIQDIIIDEAYDKYFNVKVQYVTADIDSGKQKKITEVYIVQADTLVRAYNKMEERLSGSIVDWEVPAISETKFVDAFPYIEEKEVVNETEVDFNEVENL